MMAPSVTRLIFLRASSEDRRARVLARAEAVEFATADSHPVEAETHGERVQKCRQGDLALPGCTFGCRELTACI
jgi:hypothetical protein